MKIYLCSFSDSRLKPTLKRFYKQAKESGFFYKIFLYNKWNLSFSFLRKFYNKLSAKHRGFGYWIWKPQVILQSLRRINNDSILIYIDCGSHINVKGKDRFQNYIDLFIESEATIMALQGDSPWGENPSLKEKIWTKGDLFDYFNVRNNTFITESNQYQATIIFLKKNDSTISFVKKWIRTFETNFSLIDDTLSNSPNLDGFKEHRYDQSIFSLLCKIYGKILSIPITDTWRLNRDELINYPIWAIRDKQFLLPLKTRIKKQLKSYFNKSKE